VTSRPHSLGLVAAVTLALVLPIGGCEVVFGFEDRPLRQCTPDALACDGGQRIRCDGDGLGESPEACPAEAPLCVGEGACVGCVDNAGCTSGTPCETGRCEAGACAIEIRAGQPCEGGVCTALGTCARCTGDEDCGTPEACTSLRCEGGECRSEALAMGAPCDGDRVCDAAGTCVECLDVSDCGPTPDCGTVTCESGLCVDGFAARGTACGSLDCDGQGHCGECEPGAETCASPLLLVCSSRGLHEERATCPTGCVGDECLPSLVQGTPIAHMCATWSDGSLVCWGGNVEGQLGRTTPQQVMVAPGRVPGLEGIVQASAGARHTCAVDIVGRLFCFGDNRNGQASGDGKASTTSPVQEVSLPGPARAVSAGGGRTCAMMELDGRATCWGDNGWGQLGVGDTAPRLVPTEVPGLSDVVEMALGTEMTCARTGSGDVSCWGRDDFAGTGPPSMPEARVLLPTLIGIDDAITLRGGDLSTCAVRASGLGVCWGGNSEGELGNGTFSQGLSPVSLGGALAGGGISIADVGFRHGCAAVADGVRCWGRNGCGELGFGSCENGGCGCSPGNVTPASNLVPGLGPVLDLAAAWSFTCAIDGAQVKCWGENATGQLGDATDAPSAVPVAVWPPED